jgi:predicted nucleic acid-binding protein
VSRLWIADASPVISLAHAGHLGLLDSLCPSFLIPPAVAAEIQAGRELDAARRWLADEGESHLSDHVTIDPRVMSWDLGAGESEAISLAVQMPGATVLLDDRPARNCALAQGVRIRGTLGIVVLARSEGLIPRCAPVFGDLVDSGLRVDGTTLRRALALAGETDPGDK